MEISDKIVFRRILELRDHPENDKYNSALTAQEESALRASIAEAGIQEALLIRKDGTVISGHQRKRLAADLLLGEVPTREVDCTDQEAIYLLVSLNEARRGNEKDLIKKALRVELLYKNWEIKPGRKSVQDDLDADYNEGESESVQHAHFNRHDVAKTLNLDDSSIRRLRKLLRLIPEFQKEVSEGRIGLLAGNKIASLSWEKQREFLAYYRENGSNFTTREVEEAVEKVDDFEPRVQRQERKKKEKVANKMEKFTNDLSNLMTYALEDKQLCVQLVELLERRLAILERGTNGEIHG